MLQFIFNKWMRYVARGVVPGCTTIEQARSTERPQTAKKKTADEMANLAPITQHAAVFEKDTTATLPKRLWSAGKLWNE
jgi:hypothetical protein